MEITAGCLMRNCRLLAVRGRRSSLKAAKSIEGVRPDFSKSFKWVLGDGASVLFWQHEWLGLGVEWLIRGGGIGLLRGLRCDQSGVCFG